MNYHELADSMAERFGLDPAIFRRQIQQESGFQEDAVSPAGAIGLGQVMPKTAANPGYGVTPLSADLMKDPEENLRFSAEYMRAMLDANDGDYSLALAAYNAGQGSVRKAGGIPAFKETQDYVSIILGTGSSGLGSLGDVRPVSRPDTQGGLEAALRLLLDEDGGSEGKDYKSTMSGLSMLESAFSSPEFKPVKSTASVQRGGGGGGNALSRFEGLASLGGGGK
tara:strand:+ start:62 stop:733 length:672 start_codon:yes stop_codon:yes gene_type:complete